MAEQDKEKIHQVIRKLEKNPELISNLAVRRDILTICQGEMCHPDPEKVSAEELAERLERLVNEINREVIYELKKPLIELNHEESFGKE